jgi:NAD(P)-dependent dehydrogenase (short-subunit alcohol dehydrogenase family)
MNIFVTGASRGIGLCLCSRLRALGHHVYATVRDRAGGVRVVETGARVLELDVTDEQALAQLPARLGDVPLDVLINNAGVSSTTKSINDCNAENLAKAFAVNAIAPVLVAKALLPCLALGQRKLIMNISSQLASITNNSGSSSYGYRASKTALNMLTVCMANELRPQGFTVLTLHPGWVKTDMGGVAAPMSVETSAQHLIDRMNSATPAQSGSYLNFDGNILPW